MARVLIVDDEQHVRDLAARAMRQRNFECDAADDGESAMQLFDSQPYEAVVTDLRMPNKNGHALAVELLSRSPRPKVFVLTGLSSPALVADLNTRGVTRILQKPLNFSNLADLVQADLRERTPKAPTATKATASPTPKNLLKEIEGALQELTEIFADALSGLFEIDKDVAEPPASVYEFIKRFAKQELEAEEHNAKPDPDLRSKQRVRCKAVALAVPVTKHFARCGEPFRATIRDVSESGVRLLHTRATNAQYLALSWHATTLPATDLAVVARVVRCKPRSPFYDIGGQFVLSD